MLPNDEDWYQDNGFKFWFKRYHFSSCGLFIQIPLIQCCQLWPFLILVELGTLCYKLRTQYFFDFYWTVTIMRFQTLLMIVFVLPTIVKKFQILFEISLFFILRPTKNYWNDLLKILVLFLVAFESQSLNFM